MQKQYEAFPRYDESANGSVMLHQEYTCAKAAITVIQYVCCRSDTNGSEHTDHFGNFLDTVLSVLSTQIPSVSHRHQYITDYHTVYGSDASWTTSGSPAASRSYTLDGTVDGISHLISDVVGITYPVPMADSSTFSCGNNLPCPHTARLISFVFANTRIVPSFFPSLL